MGIKTGQQFKVYEQAHDGSGCGAIKSSHDDPNEAQAEADRLAFASPGTRYYVLAGMSGVYLNAAGDLHRREYNADDAS